MLLLFRLPPASHTCLLLGLLLLLLFMPVLLLVSECVTKSDDRLAGESKVKAERERRVRFRIDRLSVQTVTSCESDCVWTATDNNISINNFAAQSLHQRDQ